MTTPFDQIELIAVQVPADVQTITLIEPTPGAPGADGAPGPANTLTIGTVSTLAAGNSATATITGIAPNQTLNLGIPQGAAGTAGSLTNNTVDISSPLTDYWTHLEILDDGSATTNWPNRFEAAFTPPGGTRGLTTYLNEYGELRVEPAKSTTVAARFFTKHLSTDPAHTVNVFELMDDRTTRTVLMSIDAAGNVKAPNLPGRISVSSTAPTNAAVNDLWVDTSS